MRDHERLDRLFEQLIEAFRADARADEAELWTAFDAGLRAHLEMEEQQILPEFAKVEPAEAATLLREHDAIRRSLDEFGVDVDLHAMRADAVERFVATLRDHARREDALMYRWAAAELPDPTERAIRAHLLRILQRELENGGATRAAGSG